MPNIELTTKEAKTLLAAIACILSHHAIVWLKAKEEAEEAEGILHDVWIKIITYFDEVSQ